jgi:hypothetical protein
MVGGQTLLTFLTKTKTLKILDLSSNQISSLMQAPKKAVKMPVLATIESLNISDNPLESVQMAAD